MQINNFIINIYHASKLIIRRIIFRKKRKKNEILAKNANDTQKQHISQALVSLLNL